MSELWNELLAGIINLEINQVIMFAVGGLLIYLAIAKDMKRCSAAIGFGAILGNIRFLRR